MKMLKTFAAGILFAISTTASANQWALHAGFNLTDVDTESTRSYSSEVGFQFGGLYYMDLMTKVKLRTGGILTQRSISSSSQDFTWWNVDVPLTGQYALNEMVSLFSGLNLSFNLSESCSVSVGSCEADSDPQFYTALALGGHVAFSPNTGLDLFYNLGLTDLAKDTGANSYGAAFVYRF